MTPQINGVLLRLLLVILTGAIIVFVPLFLCNFTFWLFSLNLTENDSYILRWGIGLIVFAVLWTSSILVYHLGKFIIYGDSNSHKN